MPTTVHGTVKDGLVVPDAPLPEGARVEIVMPALTLEVSPDLQEELNAWDKASAGALDLVERLAQGNKPDDARTMR